MSDAAAHTVRQCYRCGKNQLALGTYRILPGSSHISLCLDCYAVIWGWHEQQPSPHEGTSASRKLRQRRE